MRKMIICFIFLINVVGLHATSMIKNFITLSGDRLFAGKDELRFISFNIPNLHYIEDNMPFTESNPCRLPNDYEILDAFKSVQQMGGKVVRINPLYVRRAGEDNNHSVHVLGPGQFNEQAFKTLDKVLFYANEMGIRLIIPLVDNQENQGGIGSYAAFRNKTGNDFWSDTEIINDFKATIKYIINRKNVYTGQNYRNDKAILAWETGNKLPASPQWTNDIAAYIKSLDKNHLLIDGFDSAVVRDEALLNSYIDIITTYHHPATDPDMLEQIQQNRAKAWGRKAYIVQVAAVDTTIISQLPDIVIASGINGALLGNLYYHNRDGGYYWHSTAGKYTSFHWPGFAFQAGYDERLTLDIICQKAFQIQKIPPARLKIPEPPVLLPILDVAAISWQGSAGATTYDIERSSGLAKRWTTIAKDVNDAWVQNTPLFSDKTAEAGNTYYYRVIAKNKAGTSRPSNQVKTKRIKHLTLVDEMQDNRYLYAGKGMITFTDSNARQCKEDLHRLAGAKDASITYHLPQDIISFRLYAFYPDSVIDLKLYVSDTGEEFIPITPQKTVFSTEQNDCDYYKPALFESSRLPNYVKFLKIHFMSMAQISRMEIKYGN